MNQVPATIISEVALNTGKRIEHVISTSSGHSFPSFVAELSSKQVVYVKYSLKDSEVFLCEANNLNSLTQEKVSVPELIAASKKIIVLNYLSTGTCNPKMWKELATQLVYLHSQKQTFYGFSEDNYIGRNVQLNKAPRNSTWSDFFWNFRLLPQLKWLPEQLTYILEEALNCKNIVSNQLDQAHIYPSLLHGDLWSGNVFFSNERPYLIDPACYYGHYECDLAMTELFGGFPKEFYTEYWRQMPPNEGYEKRKHIYNFYHLLNHLNIFGTSYLPQVKQSLENILNL